MNELPKWSRKQRHHISNYERKSPSDNNLSLIVDPTNSISHVEFMRSNGFRAWPGDAMRCEMMRRHFQTLGFWHKNSEGIPTIMSQFMIIVICALFSSYQPLTFCVVVRSD